MEVEKAIEVLKNGGVVVYPTETLYGLGANIADEFAVGKVEGIKGREGIPISIAVTREEIGKYAYISELAKKIIDEFLPGPLTLLLKKKITVPRWISETDFVGIRVPENEIAYDIVSGFGAITSTSANVTGQAPPVSFSEIGKDVLDKADFAIDDGETKYKGSSTIVRVTDTVEVVREGVFDAGKLEGI